MKLFRKHIAKVALALLAIEIFEAVTPIAVFALTGGPSMPEVQQFNEAGTDEMVNLFTGDFTYNIPLMDVGGYPLSISYNSAGVQMETDAGNVGLGWNLDVGSISRDVRGLPDDFAGDKIEKKMNMKPEETNGIKLGLGVEYTGFDPATLGADLSFTTSKSNYSGWETGFGLNPSISISDKTSSREMSGTLSLGVGWNNKEGASAQPSLSFSGKAEDGQNKFGWGAGLGLDVNSRTGLKAINYKIGGNFSRSPVNAHRQHEGRPIEQVYGRGGQNVNFRFPVSFASTAFNPSMEMPQNTEAYTYSLKVGGEVSTVSITGNIGGFYSKTGLAVNVDSFPAYGYIYSHKSSGGKELLDFNREKDRPFMKELPNLPVTNFTHDLYTVTGQGVGGSFRPMRSDVGTLCDPLNSQNNFNTEIGGEISIGNLVHGGVDVTVAYTNQQVKKWTDGNALNDKLRFTTFNSADALYEPVYFKNMGEAMPMANPEQFAAIGGFKPVRTLVGADGNNDGKLYYNGTEPALPTSADFLKHKREPRNLHFAYLNAEEAAHNGLIREIRSYKPGISPVIADTALEGSTKAPVKYARNRSYRKRDHLSEVTVTRTDGARYIYGVPAYNIYSKDVSFNISGNTKDELGMVPYTAGVDNSLNNTRGLDNLYESETTPGYAYAWMLSAVLSTDYVDLTGDGPTTDDLGTYTKFNYTRVTDNYRWRTPVEQNKAYYQENNKNDALDNMANYNYGVKEVWNIHSIETRNFVAEFTYSLRDDALGVINENGGANPLMRLRKLDKITLYAKSDRLINGDRATPIKVVYFEYDYSLCPGIPNSATAGGGKLTLKKVSFSYGTSLKGRLSPFVFTYSDYNPSYHPKKIDRWGNFINKTGDDAGSYASLKKDSADAYASAWLLTGIKTPEGAQFKIQYETDEYAYVQNYRAMEMYDIAAITNEADKNLAPRDGDETVYSGDNNNLYIKFKLKKPTNDEQVLKRYFETASPLYFSCQMNLTSSSDAPTFDKVDGFIDRIAGNFGTRYGFCTETGTSGGFTHAWLKLPAVPIGDSNEEVASGGVNPFAKAAWQKIRKSLPEMIYNSPSPDTDDPTAWAESVAESFNTIAEAFSDPNSYLKGRGHGRSIKLGKSKIRLSCPDYRKFGGGARVKRITVSDSWAGMSGVPGTTTEYGTDYLYTKTINLNGTGVEVSSGVASYEPMVGGSENPLVRPVPYVIERPLSIDQSFYFTEPVGESFYPAPVIGYSQVKVRNIPQPGVTRNATGFTLHEFYTAYDFPTRTRQTDLMVNPKEVPMPPFYMEKQATVSQGFSVELNNMHGQQKGIHVYQETDSINPISGKQFIYKTIGGSLDNTVDVVDPATGAISRTLMGVDYEMYADAREAVQETFVPGAQINTDGFMASMIPVFIPMIYPEFNYAYKRYRALTFTKVIHRSGILDRVVSYNNGASASVSQSLYDKNTGLPVVTQSENEFGNDEYGTGVPAHWVYKGMEGCYKNQGAWLSLTLLGPGTSLITDADKVFEPGDEVLVKKYSELVPVGLPGIGRSVDAPPDKAWVLSVNALGVSFINRSGNLLPAGNYELYILRSGKRNLLSEQAGSVTSLTNPVTSTSLRLPETGIINAAGQDYSNHWQTYAAFQSTTPQYRCNCTNVSNKGPGKNNMMGMQAFLRTLFATGNYKARGLNLSQEPYDAFAPLFDDYMSEGPRTYSGMRNGSQLDGVILNRDSTYCTFRIEMKDARSMFPDSINNITLDPGSTEEEDREYCADVYSILGTITYKGTQGNVTAPVRITSSCIPFFNCSETYPTPGSISCSASGAGIINPFVTGILGNWRKQSAYTPRGERNTAHNADGGVLQSYLSFFSGGFPLSISAPVSNWQKQETATVIDAFGRNLETKNATGIYNAEVFGYGFSLPVLNAENARYAAVGFDGFEDYQYKNAAKNPFNSCSLVPHFKFDTTGARLDGTFSHTGYSSLKATAEVNLTRVKNEICEGTTSATGSSGFTANGCDIVKPFSPIAGKYLLSVWVNREGKPQSVTTTGSGSSFINPGTLQNILGNTPLIPGLSGTGLIPGIGGGSTSDLEVIVTTSSGIAQSLGTFSASGPTIDGWRQLNAVFDIPTGARDIKIKLTPHGTAWYDDIRIQPFNSHLKSFVYDPIRLRIMATLDENNFATIYEYDNEGNLARTKVETENNIVTLQEVRAAKPKTR